MRINNYNRDTNVVANDKWIGSDFNNGGETKNFTPTNLAAYYNHNQVIDSPYLKFTYQTLLPGEPRAEGTISFVSEIGPSVVFSSISTFLVSNKSLKGNTISQYLNFLNGGKIILSNGENINDFGFYKISNIQSYIPDPNFFTVTLQFISGNGSMIEDKDYIVSLLVDSQTVNNVVTRTSSLTNDGENGINPFISALSLTPYLLSSTASATYFPKPNGTISQYLRGDGTLATFPSITTQTLNQVLTAGNSSLLDAKIGSLYLYDATEIDYGRITLNDSDFNFYDVYGPSAKLNRNAISLLGAVGGFYGTLILPMVTANRTYTLPNASGTIALTSDIPSVTPSALTKVDDTNVTLTLGGTPSTALLQGVSLTLGWTGTLADSRIASASTWNAKQNAITLTTTGSSGSSTLISSTLNIPTYTLSGLGGVPTSRTITINGVTQDLSVDRTWTIASSGGIPHATASGTDTYTATVSGVTSYSDGDAYLIRFTNGNTTVSTLNVNSLGAIPLYENNNGPLIGGDIWDGGEMLCTYNSTLNIFQCIGTSPNSLFSYVTNAEAITITKGQVVYAFGGTGDRLTVKLANNTGDTTSAQTVGVVLSTSIATNQKGIIIVQGLLDGLSILPTSTWADGDPVYLGSTAGSITKVKPYAPNHLVYLGTVTTASNGSAGRWYVRVQNGYELDELHNVQAQSPSVNDILYYFGGSPGQWKTASIPTVLGYTPVTDARTISTTSPLQGGGDLTANRTLSILQSSGSQNGYLSSTDWSTFNSKQNTITLTTTGSSGSATLIGSTLNVPTYTLAGLGGISLTSLSSTATGLTYTNTTGIFSLTSGYLIPTTASYNNTNWDTAYTNRITSLTTTGTSGPATLVGNTLNIPQYSGGGGGSTPFKLTSQVLAVGSWVLSGGYYTYAFSNVNVTTTCDVSVTPQNASYLTAYNAQVLPFVGVAAGVATFYSQFPPQANMTVDIVITQTT